MEGGKWVIIQICKANSWQITTEGYSNLEENYSYKHILWGYFSCIVSLSNSGNVPLFWKVFLGKIQDETIHRFWKVPFVVLRIPTQICFLFKFWSSLSLSCRLEHPVQDESFITVNFYLSHGIKNYIDVRCNCITSRKRACL